MKVAKLKVYWGKSPSLDVVEYNVVVINEDTSESILDKVVSFAETEVLVNVPENTSITATVIANDGVFDSEPVSTSYQVGDLTAPAPVGFVGFELVEVIEVEDEEPVEVVEGGDLDDLGEEVDVVSPDLDLVQPAVEPENDDQSV